MIKTIPANFTLGELMAHLREEESPEGFFTLKEWAVHFKCSNRRMRDLLVEAKTAGVLEFMRIPRERLDTVITPVPGYRFDVEEDEDV